MSQSIAPEILWAQRSSDHDPSQNIILLTINVPDLQPGHALTFPTPSTLSFKGVSGGSQTATTVVPSKTYVIDNLELFGELDLSVEKKEKTTGKSLQVQLTKKELKTEYWPRLTKEKRVNFVKTDFARWVDEDEQDGVDVDEGFASNDAPPGAGMDMEAMMAQMGAGGMGGMPGMGGMGGMPGMPGMGGMGGMPGMGGMGGMPGMEGMPPMDLERMMAQMGAGPNGGQPEDDSDSDDSADDEMPPLEDTPAPVAAA